MPSNCLILCCPLLLTLSIFPSIPTFANELALCIRWPNYWNFSISISHFNEYSRLNFFNIDWFWSPFCPRDSKESSPTLHFKNINPSMLSLPYSPALTCAGFPCGLAGKESTLNAGDLGSIHWLGRFPGEGNSYPPIPVFWPGEFHRLYSPWCRKESDTTKRLSLSLSHICTWLLENHSFDYMDLCLQSDTFAF